jgi:hypothetical protein
MLENKRRQVRAQEIAAIDPDSATAAIDSPPLDREPSDLAVGMEHLRSLLERQDIPGARAWIERLQQRWPDAPQVQRFAHTLAPPEVTVVHDAPKPSRSREHQWLRDHAREYPGCWLAVSGDALVAADPHFAVVLAAAKKTGCPQDVLLHFQPDRAR